MTTHHKDLCPCGSGKRYKHCHLPADEAKRRGAWTAGIAVVAALVVGVAAWGVIQQGGAAGGGSGGSGVPVDSAGAAGGAGGDVAGTGAPVPSGAFGAMVPGRDSRAPIPQSVAGSEMPISATHGALAPGEHPVPWQYDVENNRHFDPRPGHQHWHSGPPPADTTKAVSSPTMTTLGGGSNPVVTVGGGAAKVTTTTVPVATAGSTPLAPGENPAPWEYDKAKDRHFDPRDAHRHWHAGPPPPVSQRN